MGVGGGGANGGLRSGGKMMGAGGLCDELTEESHQLLSIHQDYEV